MIGSLFNNMNEAALNMNNEVQRNGRDLIHGSITATLQGISKSVESSWNVRAHGDVREGKWRGNWRMEGVTSTLHTTSEHGVSSITTADAHTSAASSRLNWRPWQFKWTRPFPRKTKSGFCACAITFQTQSTSIFAADFNLLERYAVSTDKDCPTFPPNHL